MSPKPNFLGSRAASGSPEVLLGLLAPILALASIAPPLRVLLPVSLLLVVLASGWTPRLPHIPRRFWKVSRNWGEDFDLAEDQGTYELDVLDFILWISVGITTIFFSTFIDTNQSLAVKGGFIAIIGLIGFATMAFFNDLMGEGHDEIFSFRRGINYLAVAAGILGTVALVGIQYAVFTFLAGVPLSSVATITVDPTTAALFYTSSAVNESFAFQGAFYTVLVYALAGFEDHSWTDSLVANLIVTAVAGLEHTAVYGTNPLDIIAVSAGFFLLTFLYELTHSLTTVIVAHTFLNLLSVGTGSLFSPGAMLAGVGGVLSMAMILAVLLGYAWLSTRRGVGVKYSLSHTKNRLKVNLLHAGGCA